jgi:hypothetical protein
VVDAVISSDEVDADDVGDEVMDERFAMSGAPNITVCDALSSARAAGISHEKICDGGTKEDGELSELSVGVGVGTGDGVTTGVIAALPEDESSAGAGAEDELSTDAAADDVPPGPESEVVVAAGRAVVSGGAVVPVSVVDETAGTDVSSVEEFSVEEVGVILPEVKSAELVDEAPFVSFDDVAATTESIAREPLVVAATASPICHMNVRPTFVILLDVGIPPLKNPPQKICVSEPLLNAEFFAVNETPGTIVSGRPSAFAVFCQSPRQMDG